MDTKPSVKNVKAHFKVKKEGLLHNPKLECVCLNFCSCEFNFVQRHTNFLVVRLPPALTYTVFPVSGHVNVTGIRSFESVQCAIDKFLTFCGAELSDNTKVIIDNSTASGKFHLIAGRPDLSALSAKNSDPNRQVDISIRQNYFPSVLIRARKNLRSVLPTTVLFSNGKYNIVGGKSHHAIELAHKTVLNLLRDNGAAL